MATSGKQCKTQDPKTALDKINKAVDKRARKAKILARLWATVGAWRK